MSAWIFQANPKSYDAPSALEKLSETVWLVNQHSREIHTGDTVYIWESGGDNGGIIGVAEVLTEPRMMQQSEREAEFALDKQKFRGEKLRVKLRITKKLEKRLTRKELKEHRILNSLSIIHFAQGTNFAVTDEEAAYLRELVKER